MNEELESNFEDFLRVIDKISETLYTKELAGQLSEDEEKSLYAIGRLFRFDPLFRAIAHETIKTYIAAMLTKNTDIVSRLYKSIHSIHIETGKIVKKVLEENKKWDTR